jgi:hypothetical protein
MALYGALLSWALENGWHTTLCECHPRHESFYQRYLGFDRIAGPVAHPVFGSPSVLLRGEIEWIESVWRKTSLRRSSVRRTLSAVRDAETALAAKP